MSFYRLIMYFIYPKKICYLKKFTHIIYLKAPFGIASASFEIAGEAASLAKLNLF